MRKLRVPLDTAAEDIHTVYKSPRQLFAAVETFTRTDTLSFII